MTKDVIFRFCASTLLTIFSISLGKTICIRKLCYRAERDGIGTITYCDITGKNHTAKVEAI